MSNCYSDDGKTLYPWALQDAENIWNRFGAEALGFRTFTYGKANSRSKAAQRMTYILRNNVVWLNGSRRTDIDVLYEEFLGQLTVSLAHIGDKGVEAAGERIGRTMNARMTFWRYLEPDLRAMKTLSDERLGVTDVDNIAERQRRKRKAEILKEFHEDVKAFIRKAAYVSGSGADSNKRLEQALELARQALCRAEEDLEWSEG